MNATGQYTVKESGEVINYDYNYLVLEGDTAEDKIAFAVDKLTSVKVAGDIQRTLKVDSNNVAREKARTVNGHSSRVALTEEQKAASKAERKSNKQILEALKAKGLTLSDVEGM